jgi:uracil-DNA glycosylase
MGPIKKWGLVKCFNLENKALRPIGDLTINGIHVDTDILMRILFHQASVSKKWLKLSRMMLHQVFKQVYLL